MLHLEFGDFPTLQTSRLVLRQLEAGDSAAFFKLRSDPVAMRYVDRPLARSEDEIRHLMEQITQNFQNNAAVLWVISQKEDPAFIGNISFWRIEKENYRTEIGYMLLPEFQGKGLMSEAIRAVLAYGFDTLRFHSVEANVNPENTASIKLLEKAGFVREALFRENYHFNGKFLDSAIYSLLAKNFQ